jgi:hypothetical protein
MNNWENIKEILKLTGGKYILSEKDSPSYIIVELNEYINTLKQGKASGLESGENNPVNESDFKLENFSERELIEKINSDINVWKDLQDKRVLKKMSVPKNILSETVNETDERELEKNNFENKEEEIIIEKI